jgi:hypothetical protein
MAARWCSWYTPPLPNAGSRTNSTGIASQDHVADGIVSSEPSLVKVVALQVIAVIVVKGEVQQQQKLQVGAKGWRDSHLWRLQVVVVANEQEEGQQ